MRHAAAAYYYATLLLTPPPVIFTIECHITIAAAAAADVMLYAASLMLQKRCCHIEMMILHAADMLTRKAPGARCHIIHTRAMPQDTKTTYAAARRAR